MRNGGAVQSIEDPYLTFLRARAGRIFYRLPYPGNAGDSLIQFATQRIFDDLHVRTTVDPRDADVILVPGGNPTMWPSIGPQRWKALWARHEHAEFVVGPAGFRDGYSDWVRIVNEKGTPVSGLFARDPDSFRNLVDAGLRSGITYALSHDPALSLRGSAWLEAHRRAASEEYDLAAFRDDHETNLGHAGIWRVVRSALPGRAHHFISRRRAAAVRSRKMKLASAEANAGLGVPVLPNDVSRERFEVFVETIRAARAVHTDRLHVMLFAALLGKKVFAYPTAHAKLEGVYRHSLADWADVTFVAM
jgi:exopolysaccharide biosynthesis predicted pyruvyltransferase EpsI